MGESGTSAQTLDRDIGVTNDGHDTCTELLLEIDAAVAEFDTIFLDLQKNQTARIPNAVQGGNNANLNFENGNSSTNSDIPSARDEKNDVNNGVQEELKKGIAGNRKTLEGNDHEG